MRGSRVPEHWGFSLTIHEGQTLRKLLHEVDDDGEFPLNEMEQQVVDDMLHILEDEGDTEVPA